MFRPTSLVFIFALGSCVLGRGSLAADPSDSTVAAETSSHLDKAETGRGLILREPGVTEGYVLYTPLLSRAKYLLDNDGAVVHEWRTEFSSAHQYLLDDGSLLSIARDAKFEHFRAGGVAGYVEQIDWDSNLLWRWHFATKEAVNHHDIEPLPNGNLLVIGWEAKSQEEALRVGRRPELAPEQGLWPDMVIEVEPIRPNGARIVWEWHAWDHLVQDYDPAAPDHGDPAGHPGRIDVNAHAAGAAVTAEELAQLQALGYVPADATVEDLKSDFLHVNSVAYNARLDQIAVSVPALGEVWILDHSTTTKEAAGATGGRSGKGGNLLYRWGNPQAYRRGNPEDRKLYFQHDARWIPDGWKGAGNLTIFDNGPQSPEEPWSAIVEITPPLTKNGVYTLESGLPYGPTEPTWEYVAPVPTSFFAPFVSGAQRIANGNTMVCQGPAGRIFELDAEGNIVWDYLNPFSEGVQKEDGWVPPGSADNPFGVFRAARIRADHPALAGRSLVPLNPQPTPGIYRPK